MKIIYLNTLENLWFYIIVNFSNKEECFVNFFNFPLFRVFYDIRLDILK